MKKRILISLLVLALVAGLLPGAAAANQNGSLITWADLSTAEDLLGLARTADPAALAKNYRLTADLDLAGVDFPGLGSAQAPFTGTFDGQGYTLSNLKRTGTDNVGFVNVLRGGTVKNLTLKHVTVSGQRNVGAVVGWSQAALDSVEPGSSAAGLVDGCAVRDGSVSGAVHVGGLVGLNGADADTDAALSVAGSVYQCSADVTLWGSGEKIGGLVGANQGNVTHSSAIGTVNAPAAAMVGGLAGDNPGSVYDSFARGNVTGGNVVGGLVGSSAGKVQRVYALGDVQGQSTVGGLAGTLYEADTAVAGGSVTGADYVGTLAGSLSGRLVGAASQITVKNAYAGSPDGQSPIGNTSQYQGEGNAAALAAIALRGQDQVTDTLRRLFGLEPPKPDDPKPGPVVDQDALMDAIAAKLQASSDSWAVLDMALYATLEGKTAATTPEARQNALNLLIAEAAGDSVTVSNRARLELVLRAMGVDSTRLYAVNSNTPVDNAKALSQMDVTAGGHYAAPWVLLAARQGNLTLSQDQVDSLVALLKDNMADGLFGYEYAGVTYADPDTACAALAALAPLRAANSDAGAIVDRVLASLPGALDDKGSLGSANSDAFAIIGLVALGKDPRELTNAAGLSVVDGLLSYVNETQDGFTYAGAENALATEQGFRALVALAQFDGQALDIYDFSARSVQPGRATGAGATQRPGTPSGSGSITVRFTLKTDTQLWVPATSLTLREGSTVYHAFSQALAAAGLTAVGAEEGYVQSVSKGNVTLAEFDKGPHSGWLYKVNGQAPDLPLTAYTLKNGDTVVWYYTEDWTREPSSTSSGSSKRGESASGSPSLPFLDVAQSDWYCQNVQAVYEAGLMTGVDQTHFAPHQTTSRAMVATVLWRLADCPTPNGSASFGDVAHGQWHSQAIAWAAQAGVVQGYDAHTFGPDDLITREQLAAMLARYAKLTGMEASAGEAVLSSFADSSAVSPWAMEDVAWCVKSDILQGRGSGVLDPAAQITRAEAAAMLGRFLALVQ